MCKNSETVQNCQFRESDAVEKRHKGHRTGGTGNVRSALATRPSQRAGEFYESNVYEHIGNCATGCFFTSAAGARSNRPSAG